MSFDLIHIYNSMGTFALAVAGALIVMAIAAIAVFAERLWVLQRSRSHSRQFAPVARRLLESSSHEKLITEADARPSSHLAALLSAGTRTFVNASRRPSAVSAVELTRRELERKSESLNAEIRRGMSVLASVGSVAPFVGLLGTVVGIITCFEGISAEGSGGLGAVSAGIAEALVVTALGLLVAIPAVLAFNFLSSQADGLSLALDQARGQLVDALESGSIEPLPAGKNGVELPAPGVSTRDGEGHVRANA